MGGKSNKLKTEVTEMLTGSLTDNTSAILLNRLLEVWNQTQAKINTETRFIYYLHIFLISGWI